MYYAAKILPVFFLPSGVAVLLLLASIVFRKRWMAIAGLAVLWLSSLPIASDAVMRAAEGWQVRQPVSSMPDADAIVVLSGMLRGAPGPERVDEWTEGVDRFDAGVALVKAGKAPLLVFTGGWMPWHADGVAEGDILSQKAAAIGVGLDHLVVSSAARNTADEARVVALLLRGRGRGGAPPSIILVTSAFHMRRSRLLFTRAGLGVTPFPVDFLSSEEPFTSLKLLPRALSIYRTEVAVRELYGYLYYALIKRR
jgi:uncharacterized SAM-binding protein YcdF (DUF218 family)